MTLLQLSLTTIVMTRLVALLSLMALFSRPALTLETGYVYDTPENWTTADQYRDLKCAYLFAGLTHTRLVKLMLEDKPVLTRVAAKVAVNYYNSRAVICTLYDVTDVEIGSLWMLHLYVITVQYYHENYIDGNANEAGRTAAVRKLADITGYVTGRMQKELSDAGCRVGNRFDTYENVYAQTTAAMPSDKPNFLHHIEQEALNNCRELDKLLAANNAQSTYGTRYEALKSRPLLLNNLGVKKSLKSTLVQAYNVQVIWYGTFKLLKEAWYNVHKNLINVRSGLSTIKKYYMAHFGLFKAIVYRLTWKHLLYVKKLTGHRRVGYLKKWYDWLSDFQETLRLQDDPDVTGLLVAIDCLGRNDESIVNIIYQLQDKLYTINKYLQCKATDPMNLEPEKFLSSADQKKLDKSLDDAQDFLAYLKFAFQKVDFDLVRSVVTYVYGETKW